MEFSLDMPELIARARGDLRMGVPIVLVENGKHTLVHAIETLSETRFSTALTLSADSVVAITARRAETLKARAYDGDLARIELPEHATLKWTQSLADPAGDMNTPMKGPLRSTRGGNVDAHRLALRLTKDARLLPSVLVTPIGADHDTSILTHVGVTQASHHLTNAAQYLDVIHARLPMQVSDTGRLHVFRPDDGAEEHYAIEIGRIDTSKPVLARLHSACFTGDMLGSLKCDCGPQLRGAMTQMGVEGAGILLYLNQEGRGIGLANKMRAYSLQDQGYDTVEANHRLGFEDDERDFRIGSALLRKLGISDVRLLTNNPAKIEMMQRTGINVSERVPLIVGENPFNTEYLKTKAKKSGHML